MILSDKEIKQKLENWEISIETRKEYDIYKQIWPASLDFRLWNVFKIYKKDKILILDPTKPIKDEDIDLININNGEYFILHPWQFVLGVTIEKIKVPYDLVARCEGRSSIWRLWVVIHSTAGFIDPWFDWTVTLEIKNINEVPIALYPWMRIWQFAFETIKGEVEIPYDKRKWSKYMNQVLPEQSRIAQDLY